MKRRLSVSFRGSESIRHAFGFKTAFFGLFALAAASCSSSEIVDPCQNACLPGEVCQSGGVCRPLCLSDGTCSDPALTCQDNICKTQDELLCRIGALKCSDDNASVLVCGKDQHYAVKEECPVGYACNSGRCLENACADGVKRCYGGNVEICQNSSYTIYTECESPERCDEETFECIEPPECQDGNKRCRDNDVEICSGGQYQSYKTCPAGKACDNATRDCAQTAQCLNGRKECVGDDYRECENGVWNYKTCGGALTCSGQGECSEGACEQGATRCADQNGSDIVQICSDGDYVVSQICNADQTCSFSDGVARCVTTGELCETSYTCKNNILYKCDDEDGTMLLAKNCTNLQSCNASTADCDNLCGNGVIDEAAGEECDGTIFKAGATCATVVRTGATGSLACDPLTCKIIAAGCSDVQCETNQKVCDGNTFKSCVGGIWQTVNCSDSGATCDISAQGGCNADSGGECPDDGKKCSGNVYSYCYKGIWASHACESGEICHVNAQDGCYAQTVVSGYDHVQDFEIYDNWTDTTTYSGAFSDDQNLPIKYEFTARTNTYRSSTQNIAIGGRSIILRKSNNNYFQVTGISGGIKKIAFKWRKWDAGDKSADIQITVGATVVQTIDTTASSKDVQEFSIEIDDALRASDTIDIRPTGNKDSRIVIDDIMWSDK